MAIIKNLKNIPLFSYRRSVAKILLAVVCGCIIFAANSYAIETPTGIYFDEISSNSITASGYVAAGFTGLETGLSGVAVAINNTYNPWRNGNIWTTKAVMPTARQGLSAGVIGGKLYTVGGINSSYLNTNEEYDPVSNTWTTKTAMPTARSDVSAGVIGGKLYAVGGWSGSNDLNTNEEYDPASNTWTTKAVMPTARRFMSAGVAGGKLYVAGGFGGSSLNTNEEYDPASNTWTTKAVMPTVRYYLAAGVMDGKLYVVGGVNGPILNTNEEYDPASNTWSTKAIIPTARYALSAGVIGGKLYAVGGAANGSELNTNEEYDPAANSWSTKAVMPSLRIYLSAGVIGGKLYTVGGNGGLNANEEYDPGVAHSFTGLTPNTQYSFKAKARDSSGAETAETAVVSTYTLAAIPAAGSPVFTAVGPTTFTANWLVNGNPSGTVYRAQISASSAFTTVMTSNTTGTSAVFTGLTTNTLYYARVAAINGNGILTDYLALGSVTATAGNNAPTLAWTGETGYTADGLNFATGASTTTFIYRVKYADANNDAPGSGYPKVHIKKGGVEISGSPFTMTFVSGAYNTGAIYTHSRTLATGTNYTYYFEAQDTNSAVATGAPTSAVDAPDVSDRVGEDLQEGFKTTLANNLFSPKSGGLSRIKFNVPASGKVSMKIYDLSGRFVRTLYEGDATAGYLQKTWNGKDDDGRYVIPSVYFLHYVYPGGKEVRRIGVKK